MPSKTDIDRLLSHADWLRALAAFLLRDASEAEDVVQETWASALRAAPDPDRPARPWLAQVLRNTIRDRLRAGARRRAREEAVAALTPAEVPAVDGVLERMQLHRKIAELVVELEEPYRSALLLRFYEGRAPTEVANALGIPPGTVRWRINEGVRRLRERLDAVEEGPQSWRMLLAPLLPPAVDPGPTPLTSTAATAGTRVLAAALVTAVIAGGLFLLGPDDPGAPSAGQPRAPAPALAEKTTPDSRTVPPATNERETMTQQKVRLAAALFGVVLPTLVASAREANAPLSRDEMVAACVETREKSYECREPFIDAMMELRLRKSGKVVTPEEKARMREVGLREIAEDGSGPLEPRKAKCAAMYDKMSASRQAMPREQVDKLKSCYVDKDCKARVACMMPIFEALMFAPKPK